VSIEEIRLQRTHITEEAAHLAVLNDFVAFKKEFPSVIVPAGPHIVRLGEVTYPESLEYGEYVMRERYADYGLVACILFIHVNFDKTSRDEIDAWLDQLHQARQIDCNPSGI
jgi:hypothetical protein